MGILTRRIWTMTYQTLINYNNRFKIIWTHKHNVQQMQINTRLYNKITNYINQDIVSLIIAIRSLSFLIFLIFFVLLRLFILRFHFTKRWSRLWFYNRCWGRGNCRGRSWWRDNMTKDSFLFFSSSTRKCLCITKFLISKEWKWN